MTKYCERDCGVQIEWKGKTGEYGSTGFFEVESGLEHTFNRCDEIKDEIQQDNEMIDTVGKSNL